MYIRRIPKGWFTYDNLVPLPSATDQGLSPGSIFAGISLAGKTKERGKHNRKLTSCAQTQNIGPGRPAKARHWGCYCTHGTSHSRAGQKDRRLWGRGWTQALVRAPYAGAVTCSFISAFCWDFAEIETLIINKLLLFCLFLALMLVSYV